MGCTCTATFANTGVPGCDSIADITARQIIVPRVAADGTRNKIAGNATIDATYINARINDPDPTKRWYPLPLIVNVDDVRGDDVTEELNNGTILKIRDGSRTHNSLIIGQGPHYLKKLKGHGCQEFGMYNIDMEGSLIGQNEQDGTNDIYPNPIEKGSWSPRLVGKTDTTFPKIEMRFQYRLDAKDEWLEKIPVSQITGVNLLTIDGLQDVNVEFSGISTTGFTARFFTDFGDWPNYNPVEGLVAGDFTLAEVSPTPGAVSITSVTESTTTPGTYVFVIAAQTSGDDLRLTGSKDGLDFSRVTAEIIEIP